MNMKGASQDTVAVEGQHKFDEAALAEYLARALPGFEGSLTVRKFGYGQSNPTYFLETSAGQKYVLRKKPPGKLIKGAHAVDREYRVMHALGQAGFEVPLMHSLCEDESVIGTTFYVMQFVKGPIMDNALAKASAPDRRGIMMSIVQTLAKLHRYDPAELGLLDPSSPFGRVGGFYERQIATMERTSTAQVSNSDGKVPPMRNIATLLSMFRSSMPKDVSCVIHGDWKPDNMIISTGEHPKVVAVLDWELSTIGHPMSDLANMCLPYHMPQGNPVGWPIFDVSPEGGIPSEEDVLLAYCKAADAPYPIADWDFFVAFACLRLAVIVQGVAMRAAKGQASAVSSAAGLQMAQYMATSADFMCDLGLDIMRKAGKDAAAHSASKL